jgi:hypothetical protein
MSDSTLAAVPSDGAKVRRIPEAVIRIAGNSQDGIQAIGGFLARLAGRSEQEVMTFMTIHDFGWTIDFPGSNRFGRSVEFRGRGGCVAGVLSALI